MDHRPLLAVALLAGMTLSGCLGGGDGAEAPTEEPPDWDAPPPARSALASEPWYELRHSSSFLLKDWSYGRYVVRVPERLEDVQVFFTTTNAQSTGRAPDVNDPDRYHFMFMQVRPLGREARLASVDAVPQFRHAAVEEVFTLTYLYGQGVDYQFLAPYAGDPDHWVFEPGLYEFVVATDEKLTVGINVRTSSPYWKTYYHPQELGEARAERLAFEERLLRPLGGMVPDQDRTLEATLRAAPGERLNYFAFSDLYYETRALALGAQGTATVYVNDEDWSHRLGMSAPGPQRDEAYAFALEFNRPGPAEVDVRARTVFHEEASAESLMLSVLMIFGVALIPLETLAAPAGADLA